MKREKPFTTVITCMDGRIQLPVMQWIEENYGSMYPDTVTEPGPVRILSESQPGNVLEQIKKRVEISVNVHKSKRIFIVAHDDCAGNPVDKKSQWKQMKKAVETVKNWKFGVELVALWVDLEGKITKMDLD